MVLDRSFLPGTSAILVPRTDDGRVLFAIPWHDRVLVGTTDTPVADLPIEPRPRREEIAYLLDHASRYLERSPGASDVLGAFAGLRPLLRSLKGRVGGATAKLSREHAVVISGSGLVTITGGKWTTYRRMAIDAVDHAAQAGGLAARPSTTDRIKLHGWVAETDKPNGSESVYGSDASALQSLCLEHPDWEQRLHPSLAYRVGEIVWAARHEAARSVEDVLARRTQLSSSTPERVSRWRPRWPPCWRSSFPAIRTGKIVRSSNFASSQKAIWSRRIEDRFSTRSITNLGS